MENKTIEQIQNEVLELTNKIESVKNNLTELQKQESQKSKIDFLTFMDWADEYFRRKDNIYQTSRNLEFKMDIDDCCNVDLSLCGNEIEISKEWTDTSDIVDVVLDLTRVDFKLWMNEEYNNHTGKENENNL
jgi:hypothetical protein